MNIGKTRRSTAGARRWPVWRIGLVSALLACAGAVAIVSPAAIVNSARTVWNSTSRAAPQADAAASDSAAVSEQAFPIPDLPLQTGQAPAPNMMFLLDNSSSMIGGLIPANMARPVPNYPAYRSPDNNPVYYDPEVTYKPWRTGDDKDHCQFPNLLDSDNVCRYPDATIDNVSYNNALVQFDKQGKMLESYSLLTHWSLFDLYLPKSGTPVWKRGDPLPPYPFHDDYTRYWVCPGKDYQDPKVVRFDDGGHIDYNFIDCTIMGRDGKRYAGTPATPTGRSQQDELTNIANWYTYYSTRIKLAKAAAAEAFANVDGDRLRVGFNVIGNADVIPEYPIPATTDGGLFRGDNKTSFYTHLLATGAPAGTPLRRALALTGQYFANAQPSTASPPTPDPFDSIGSDGTPEQLSCRQNFVVLATDGAWTDTGTVTVANLDQPDPETANDPTRSLLNTENVDATAGPEYPAPEGETGRYTPALPYMDGFAGTLADVAMYYWKNDLRPLLPNNVPSSTDDPAFWQHLVTFTISIGQRGQLTPSQETLEKIREGGLAWPDPASGSNNSGCNEDDPTVDCHADWDTKRIDDLWHAAVNGHGSFVVANNVDQFTQALKSAINTAISRGGSGSALAANSTQLNGDTRVYQARYQTGRWSGELAAYPVSASGRLTAEPSWKASERLAQQPWSQRRIYTYARGTGGTSFPTSVQQSLFGDRADALGLGVDGQAIADWLKGDQSKEQNHGGPLRSRSALLGDIIDSSPVYVHDTKTLYVGANDGMLHAFDAASGDERFAYVPAGLAPSTLAILADPKYAHRYFVDGPITLASATRDGLIAGRDYLVAALGRGGKGVFALDVSDPANFDADNVLWDHTSPVGSNTDADLGQVLGAPLIVRLNDGQQTPAAVFGNGVNSGNGHAVLYVLNLDTGAEIARLDTGAASGGPNGLSAPRGWDADGNGTVDAVYAGDQQGNLWKFDFSGVRPAIALNGQPLYQAGDGHPISAGLAVAKDPASGQRWVFFGTGRYLTEADATDTTTQSLYGVIDNNTPTTRDNLQERTFSVTAGGERGFEPHGTLPSGKRGWVVDLPPSGLPPSGERIVVPPVVDGHTLIAASSIPPTRANPCEVGGSGYLNALDAFTGTSTEQPYFSNTTLLLLPNPGNGPKSVPVGSVALGGMPSGPALRIGNTLMTPLMNGRTDSRGVETAAFRRLNWREIRDH